MENSNTGACGVMEGALPGKCASLVFPYIPMQGSSAGTYDQAMALETGTLFPGLNLPFFKATKSKMNCDNTALCELMALGFAVTELGLYLDTHKDDKEALDLYLNYAALLREGTAKYEKSYGPLRQTSVTEAGYTWVNGPWPWEGGRK